GDCRSAAEGTRRGPAPRAHRTLPGAIDLFKLRATGISQGGERLSQSGDLAALPRGLLVFPLHRARRNSRSVRAISIGRRPAPKSRDPRGVERPRGRTLTRGSGSCNRNDLCSVGHEGLEALHGTGVELRDARLAHAELDAEVLELHAAEVVRRDDVALSLGQ